MSPDRLYLLVVRHFDGGLAPDEAAELAAALRDDPAARAAFAAVQAQILAVADVRAVPAVPARMGRRGWRHLVVASTAAALLLAASLDAVWRWTRPDPRGPVADAIVATVERSVGTVRAGEGGPPVASGTLVRAGQTVSTVGTGSAVALRRAGGSPLFLGGDTTVTLPGPQDDRVAMTRGDLALDVSCPEESRAFEVTTPEARIETRRSKLLVSRDDGRTQVRVLDGTARVEDPVSHATADMGIGDWAEAAGGAVRVTTRTTGSPDAVDLRFAGTLPAGWRVGALAPDGVRAVPVAGPEGLRHRVVSADDWTGGLFALADDTWVSVRFRVVRPGPVRVALVVRPQDAAQLPGIVLEAPLAERAEPDGWRTAHVPARGFRPARGFGGLPDFRGVCCAIVLETDADLGLVIRRVWVSRGPGPEGR